MFNCFVISNNILIFAAVNQLFVKIMTSLALNNLWTYIDSLSLKQKDREWLADKLLGQKKEDNKTAHQKAYVKESLTRALNEVKAAQKEGKKLKTLNEFLEELKEEEA